MNMHAFRFSSQMHHVIKRCLSTLPGHSKVIMPKVSPTMTAGRLVSWKKEEGDAIIEGEDLAEIESDKATMPISARYDGFIARIFVKDDTADIPLGNLLAITVEEQEHINAFKDYQSLESSAASPPPLVQNDGAPVELPSKSDQPPLPASDAISSFKYEGPIGPAVLRLLNQHPHLVIHQITPTGPKGRLLKGDVLNAVKQLQTKPQKPSPTTKSAQPEPNTPSLSPFLVGRPKFTDVPVSSMRRAIANRLCLSKSTIPHQYATARYRLDNLIAFRKRLNSLNPSIKISVNDIMIKAASLALKRVPEMNARWDDNTSGAIPNDGFHVSMAVAIPGGLITPIVSDVDKRSLANIATLTKELVVQAKEGTLAPDQYEGGNFSLTNLGMYGISNFSAIINPPQSGILAIGAPIEYATVDDDDNVSVTSHGVATLSSDARVITQTAAGQFLDEFSSCINDPSNMII